MGEVNLERQGMKLVDQINKENHFLEVISKEDDLIQEVEEEEEVESLLLDDIRVIRWVIGPMNVAIMREGKKVLI